jgi:hypothetical protein
MPTHPKPPVDSTKKASAARVRAHRARLRAQGLRPVQIWVPDMSTEEFKREARRQSLAIATHPGAADEQAWIDAITDADALYERDEK